MLQPAESSWIEPLVLALYRPTFQLAALHVRDYGVAQDILQEAFVRVWLSPRTPRDMSAFRPWLYKTVVNLARDHQRRQSRWARLRFGRATSADPMDVAERHQSNAALRNAMRLEIAFDWHRNTWASAASPAVIRSNATATVLDDGQVLVAGGFGSGSTAWAGAELYDPQGSHSVGITRRISAPAPVGGVAPLLAVGVVLALALWWRGRRRARQSQAGVIWID